MNSQTPFETNHRPQPPSTTQPIDPDKPLPIREWQARYERYLELIGRQETRKRYARALDRFFGKHPKKTFGHEFLRPVINDYVEHRLAEGASVATVRLELSAIRGLFEFMLEMKGFGIFFNPAKNVRVKKPKVGSPEARSERTESAA